MFRKKVCGRCGNTLKNKYTFCPYCGSALEKKEENFGMLGKNDFLNTQPLNDLRFPMGFNAIFNSLLKNLEKQFNDIEKKTETEKKNNIGNISISISSLGDKSPFVRVNSKPVKTVKLNKKKDLKKNFVDSLSTDKLKKFSSLPREEPNTNIRRLSNKIIYEISLPGVKSLRDISLLNLEKNRELKAISEKKSYLKSLPNYPIINYKLSRGKLTLELDAGEN